MVRKLSEIKEKIESEALPFRNYLDSILTKSVKEFIENLLPSCYVYIFSGIIRDYFLNKSEHRDLDIMISGDVDLKQFVKGYKYKRNRFGGYKIIVDKKVIDLWRLEDTWAINYQKIVPGIQIDKYIPHTAFFNFSSIIFFLNNNQFFFSKDFTVFLRDKVIDLVFTPNPNEALCVVNSLYYSDKLGMKLGDKLIQYLKKVYKNNIDDLEKVQISHFNKVVYKKEEIIERIRQL